MHIERQIYTAHICVHTYDICIALQHRMYQYVFVEKMMTYVNLDLGIST